MCNNDVFKFANEGHAMQSGITRFKDIVGSERGKNFLIICPGKSVLKYWNNIKKFIAEKKPIVLGINNITDLYHPDIHLWTNNERLKQFGGCILKKSTVFIGCHILAENLERHKITDYTLIDYTDRDKTEKPFYDSKNGIIKGYYRTSGCLAIMICHLLGAKNIYIAGLDGFSFDLKQSGEIHWYTSADEKKKLTCTEYYFLYDAPMKTILDTLKKTGLYFKIITPTLFNEHYSDFVIKA